MNTIITMKQEINYRTLPRNLQKFKSYVDKLEFEEEPDYQYLSSLFIDIQEKQIKEDTFF